MARSASDARLLKDTMFAKPDTKKQYGTPTEKAMVKAEVARRFPKESTKK